MGNLIKKAILGCFLAILGPSFAFAGSIGVNSFSGLDTQDPPSALQPNQSQDLLNVRIQPGGRSVYKRDGIGLFQTVNTTYTTHGIHGGYHFQQSGGADVQLWASSTTLYGIVNDVQAVALASGTVDATWQCTDNLGFAYCVTSSHDTPVKTDGSVANTTYQTTIPAGTIITSTPLQLVVAGVSGSASSIYVSANNNFTNFTTGPLPTDPYVEIINAPGSRLTQLGYYFGNLYWWKDQSVGYVSGSASQGSVGITIISNQIGTLDNSSAFWNPTTYDQGNKFNTGTQTTSAGNPYFNEMSSLGGIFFRGQDNHIYQYDGYTLTRLSRIITPNITASSRRKANSWTQTTGTDFNGGASSPTVNISTSISPGDVTVSSFAITENSSTQWNLGVTSNISINSTSMQLLTNNSGSINDPSFEGTLATNFTQNSTQWSFVSSVSGIGCTINPQSGSQFSKLDTNSIGVSKLFVTWLDLNNVGLSTATIIPGSDCAGWASATLPSSGIIGKRAKLRFCGSNGGVLCDTNSSLTTLSSYIVGGDLTFFWRHDESAGPHELMSIDNVQNGSSTITSGSFASQVYDTGFTSSTLQLQSSFSANTSTPSFSLLTSTGATGPFVALLTSTATNAVGNRYVEYSSTISITSTDNALTSLTSFSIISKSTGSYYSAVDNAPALSSWGTLAIDDNNTGISSITYYSRASTSPYTVLSATPTWVLQPKNSNVTASTGTYMQLRGDFYLSAATETPTLNDFTFNWFEGSASDKAYIQYFQDAIWFGVSSGSSTSTNNTNFYLDLLNNTWLKDNIGANGFAVENNALYIGDPLTPTIYKFGGVTTDKGSAIQSYWKSMDFTGQDPTVQNSFEQADFAFKQSSTTITFTYSVDQSTSLTKSKSLSLYSARNSLIKRGFALANGEIGTYYNFMVGDNSSLAAWTLMGQRTTYDPLPWRPQESN